MGANATALASNRHCSILTSNGYRMPSAFWILTPPSASDAQLAIAAAQAGEIGLFDLGSGTIGPRQATAVASLAEHAGSDRWGVRVEALFDETLVAGADPLDAVRASALRSRFRCWCWPA